MPKFWDKFRQDKNFLEYSSEEAKKSSDTVLDVWNENLDNFFIENIGTQKSINRRTVRQKLENLANSSTSGSKTLAKEMAVLDESNEWVKVKKFNDIKGLKQFLESVLFINVQNMAERRMIVDKAMEQFNKKGLIFAMRSCIEEKATDKLVLANTTVSFTPTSKGVMIREKNKYFNPQTNNLVAKVVSRISFDVITTTTIDPKKKGNAENPDGVTNDRSVNIDINDVVVHLHDKTYAPIFDQRSVWRKFKNFIQSLFGYNRLIDNKNVYPDVRPKR